MKRERFLRHKRLLAQRVAVRFRRKPSPRMGTAEGCVEETSSHYSSSRLVSNNFVDLLWKTMRSLSYSTHRQKACHVSCLYISKMSNIDQFRNVGFGYLFRLW